MDDLTTCPCTPRASNGTSDPAKTLHLKQGWMDAMLRDAHKTGCRCAAVAAACDNPKLWR